MTCPRCGDAMEWYVPKIGKPLPRCVTCGPSDEQAEYAAYLASDEWKRIAYAAKWHCGFRCVLCGARDNLQAHHSCYKRTPGREGPWDVTCLCSACHEATTEMLKARKERTSA